MAKHFMAVCVVCLLCAEHLPCKEHIEDNSSSIKSNWNTNNNNNNDIPIQYDNISSNPYKSTNNIYDKRKNKTKFENDLDLIRIRNKRHHDHHHHHQHDDIGGTCDNEESNEISKMYIKKLFERFSYSDKKDTMNLEEFEKMLDSLDLYNLKKGTANKNNNETNNCLSSIELFHRISSNPSNYEIKSNLYSSSNEKENNSLFDSSVTNTTNKYNTDYLKKIKETILLSTDDLIAVCPILLYHFTAQTSLEKSGCISSNLIPPRLINEHKHEILNEIAEHRGLVWLYSTLSILGVSLCGLLGVAVIPCMDKRFYSQMLQFLVSLAVGTLTGDALLHLLPHAFMINSSSDDPHKSMILKGLVSVLGIIFFFFMERGLIMIADWRKKRQKNEKPCSIVRVLKDPATASPHNPNGEKICKNKYSSYPYCYDEIANDTKDDHHHHHARKNCDKTPSQTLDTSMHIDKQNNKANNIPLRNHDHGDFNETAQSLLAINYTINDNYTSDLHNHISKEQQNDNNTVSTNLEDGSLESIKDKQLPKENFTIILREHESKHHGHSHTHGHVHSPPRSLSAVAWMVVMGDGLHNFTDGMTIGAAFSNSIAGGFSTAIAVFCHELPHELGDFAVLLKAGMTPRQAVYYNILSSVLSFFGMVLGVLIGERPEASEIIFACAAGMFIYIALVDMMPEITASHKERCQFSECIIQFFGMITGLGIMLLIALYEHDLKEIFTHDHS